MARSAPVMFSPFRQSERDPLWRREMRERWRRPITLLFLMVYVAGLSYVAYSLYAAIVPTTGVQLGMQSRGIGHQLFISLLGAQIGAWIPIAFFLAAPTIAAERERRNLPEYLLAGIQPRQIVRAKFASVATFIIVMCAVPLPVLALCFPLGGVEPLELFVGAFLEIAVALVCASCGLMISILNARVTSAMQQGVALSVVFMIAGVAILPGVLDAPFLVWLMLALLLVFVARAMIGHCENSLDLLAHNLEENERALQPPAPVLPAPRPQNIQPSVVKARAKTPRFEPARRSYIDRWIEKAASRNAVTQREVRVGLRASRSRLAMSSDENIESKLIRLWLSIGFFGTALIALLGFSEWWYFSLRCATLALLVVTGISSSATFTREREQKTLAQLRLCPLSPFQVVWGKIAAILLLVTRGWSGPLLALYIIGLTQGLDIALGSALFLGMCVVFAASIATLFSLICRHTPVATGGTMGAILFAFIFLGVAPQGLVLFFPALRSLFNSFALGAMWATPLDVVLGLPHFSSSSLSFSQSLFRLTGSLAALNVFLIGGATLLLTTTRLEESDRKPRFWERDLARSWR